MGLFDFLRKKNPANIQVDKQAQLMPVTNAYLLKELENRLSASGYDVQKNQQYESLTINAELEIATAIIDSPDNHPAILHVKFLSIHPTCFPDGIDENIVGIGATPEEKVQSVLNNYLNTTFPPIMQSLSDNHNPAIDFYTSIENLDVQWHPALGVLALQGKWDQVPTGEPLFGLIKEKIQRNLNNQKFNWLKLYVARQQNGEIISDCLLNNEPWQQGLDELNAYAKQWPQQASFLGQKQFMIFRRCDAFDK
ncbi:MAG: DUF6348 family protein [Chitinophagaceae bacterium]